MREKKQYTIITFHTTTEAMAMEKICNSNDIRGRLIPVPREISAGCGLAWRMDRGDFYTFQENILKLNLEYDQIVELTL